MSSVTDFDESKFYLGSLCKRGHNWDGKGQSLRDKTRKDCIDCRVLYRKEQWVLKKAKKKIEKAAKLHIRRMIPQVSLELMDLLDTSRYFLGNPCPRNHRWNDTWYCLRTFSRSECIECKRGSGRTKAALEKVKKYQASEKGKEQRRRYKESGRDKEVKRKYWKSEKGRINSRLNSLRRCARKKAVHNIKYTYAEALARCQDFNNQCAYCGATEKLSLDHFLPIAHGGADVISNLVPACMTCNVRKSAQDPKLWYQAQDFYSAKNWKKILKVLGKTDANYLQIPLL